VTARHHVRVGGRVAHARTPIDATPAPTLGEMLLVARERKGVDLHRAERDTKIRFRHLVALETDDYDALPGNVYARGFLRNYALYLGLDPDEMLVKWHREQDLHRRIPPETIIAPPRPIAEPRAHLRFSRALLALIALVVVAITFGGYVGLQLVRFSQVPGVAFDGPPRRDLPPDAQSTNLRGTSTPGFTIVVTGPGDFLKTVQVAADASWAIEVPVTKGQNDFAILARDPTTNRDSPPTNVIVMVPVPASPSAAPPTLPTTSAGIPIPAAQLVIVEPTVHARIDSDTVRVAGTSDAASVTISATYVGPLGQGSPTVAPAGAQSPAKPTAPSPVQAATGSGAFSGSLVLAAGRWLITATTAAADGLTSTTRSTPVDVTYRGMVLMVAGHGGPARITVWADGVLVQRGVILRDGQRKSFTARLRIVVQTGNGGVTAFTFNGKALGIPGTAGQVERWQFDKGRPHPRRIR
jgi:hypothetical protein